MSTSKIYDYTDSTDYNYNTTNIEVTGGVAKLKLIPLPGQTVTEDFSSATGWTVEPEAEITGGVLRQVDQLGGASLGAPFTVDEDATSGDGVLTGTLVNSATVHDGSLDLSGGSTKYLSYDATGKINATKGTVRFNYKPNYTGNPPSDVILFRIANSLGSTSNDLYFYHDTASALRLTTKTSTGSVLQTALPFGTKSLTAGVVYDMTFTWDYELGETEIFIDGVQQGSTRTTISTARSDDLTSITYLGIGDQAYSDGYYDDVLSYPLAKYNDAPASPYSIPEYRYQASYNISPEKATVGSPDGSLVSVDELTITSSTDVRYTVNDPDTNIGFWYDVSIPGWTLSSNTYATANTEAEIEAHLISFPFPDESNAIKFAVVFHDSNGQQDYVDNMLIEYTNENYPTTDDVIAPITSDRMWAEDFVSFAESVTLGIANTAVQYIMTRGGTDLYWDGAAWSTSSNNWATSNTASDVNTNIGSLVPSRVQVGFKALLRSTDGDYSPSINSNTFVFDQALPDVDLPRSVDINGYVYTNCCPVVGQIIEVRPYQNGFSNPGSTAGIYNLRDWVTIGTTASDGYFSGAVFLQPVNKFWEFRIKNDKVYTQLPDQDNVDFSTLTLTPSEDN